MAVLNNQRVHGELEHGPFVDDLLIESGDVPVRKNG